MFILYFSRLTSEFEHQVSLTLNNTATIISALFPLQCFSLCDDKQLTIVFKNEAEPLTPGGIYIKTFYVCSMTKYCFYVFQYKVEGFCVVLFWGFLFVCGVFRGVEVGFFRGQCF